MHTFLILALKGAAGGGLVVAFALLGELVEPKRFAGLFSAAPSIALANLTIVLLTKGHREAHAQSLGMIVGAAGFIGFTLVARRLVVRFEALRGSALASLVWIGVAIAGYAAVFR